MRFIFECDITAFKDLEWEGMFPVFSNGFKKSWEKGCTNDLVLCSLGVGEFYGGLAVVFAVEPSEVLVVGAENERHDFCPSGHSRFLTDNIRELVQWEGLSYGSGGRECLWKVVVPISNGYVFHNITLVENIRAGNRDFDIDEIWV